MYVWMYVCVCKCHVCMYVCVHYLSLYVSTQCNRYLFPVMIPLCKFVSSLIHLLNLFSEPLRYLI